MHVARALTIGTIFVALCVIGDARDILANASQIRTKISFEGLVALVRSPTFHRGAILAVEATQATLQRDLPRHHAILIIPMDAVKQGTPDTFADRERRQGVWRLGNQRVTFSSSASDERLRPVHTAGEAAYPRSSEEWRDVKWIMDMERLVGVGRGGIKPDLMTTRDLRDSILAARIDLGGGTLEATEPAEPWNQGEVRFLVLQGLTAQRPVQQAVTQRLLYTPPAAESFRILLTPSDGKPPRQIDLRPTVDVTSISISNQTSVRTLMNPQHDDPAQAVHFLAYYDLLAATVPTPLVPSALVPFQTTYTSARPPGDLCPPGAPAFTWSFDR